MKRSRVITFYSYKGGVGRTFALANTAALLTRWGFRVLCVDWDLEAPGLRHYFQIDAPRPGVVDLVLAHAEGKKLDWRQLLHAIDLEPLRAAVRGGACLHVLSAGQDTDEAYGKQLGSIDWRRLYSERGLGHHLESLRHQWRADYDFVLVDSRTGLTDVSGICTAQLPDILVLAFAQNHQGLDGALKAAVRARGLREALPLDRAPTLEVPLSTRFDDAANAIDRSFWQREIAGRLKPHYDLWRDKDAEPEQLLELLRIPYKPRWSLGERLAVLEESDTDPSTISYSLATLAAVLARDLQDTSTLVRSRGDYVQHVASAGRSLVEKTAAPGTFDYDLFLSYPSADVAFARQLLREIEQQSRGGVRVFLAHDRIASGTDWVPALQRSLQQARHMLVVANGDVNPWQQAEVAAFQLGGAGTEQRRILPVWRERGQSAWTSLQRYQAFDGLTLTPAQLADATLRALGKEAPPPRSVEPSSDPLQLYRDHVAATHEHLVPFFAGASDQVLAEVFVELELAPEPFGTGTPQANPRLHQTVDPEADIDLDEGMGLEGRRREFLHRPWTLRELLTLERPGAHYAVLGDPGAGKTTLARHLARTLALAGKCPVFLSLARHGRPDLDPFAAAVRDLPEDLRRRAPDLFEQLQSAATRGQVVLLLDGLDEVDPALLDRTTDCILDLARQHPKVPIAVCTRPIALERRELGRALRRVRVQPLDAARQGLLLDRLLGPSDGALVRREVLARPALADLCRNPLLLTLAAVVARDALLAGAPLPNHRGKLYATALDLLLRRGHCPEPRGVKDPHTARQLLRQLSLELHRRGGETWSEAQLADVLVDLRRADERLSDAIAFTWSTPADLLRDLGTNSGVLGPHDGPLLPWRYLHRSLREFLAAEQLACMPPDQLQTHMSDWRQESERHAKAKPEQRASLPAPTRWGEVYGLLCGLTAAPLQLLQRLRAVSPALALRALPSVDSLPAAEGFAFLFDTPGWTFPQAEAVWLAWQPAPAVAAAAFYAAVNTQRTVDELGSLWAMLEAVGVAPDRARFFVAAGRPIEKAPALEWVQLPAGSFRMGSPDEEDERHDDESPQHEVSVAAFRLARTAVTNAQYLAFDPNHKVEEWHAVPRAELQEHPVVNVNWWSARAFCAWLGARLPTEAEWEYACRAGKTTPFSFGGNITPQQVNYDGNFPYASGAEGLDRQRTVPVASLPASAFGLHEMHGNVWEWCEDWLGDYSKAPTDGTAQQEDIGSGLRVTRGGSWFNGAGYCRSAYRRGRHPGDRHNRIGLRPASSQP